MPTSARSACSFGSLTSTTPPIPADALPYNALANLFALRDAGYEVLLSIGELEENRIGSNCGQYIQAHLEARKKLKNGYACLDELELPLAASGEARRQS